MDQKIRKRGSFFYNFLPSKKYMKNEQFVIKKHGLMEENASFA